MIKSQDIRRFIADKLRNAEFTEFFIITPKSTPSTATPTATEINAFSLCAFAYSQIFFLNSGNLTYAKFENFLLLHKSFQNFLNTPPTASQPVLIPLNILLSHENGLLLFGCIFLVNLVSIPNSILNKKWYCFYNTI